MPKFPIALAGHTAAVHSLQFSHDGKRALTAVRVWDAQTARQIKEPEEPLDWVYDASFSPDSQRIATASHDGKAYVWQL